MSNIFDLFRRIEKKESTEPIYAIIAGLGNPGEKYERTRHNVGFLAIDYIAERCGVKINRARFRSLVAEATLGGHRVLLMKPETFMNNSGEAVGAAAAFYKIPPERVLILHDEISFEAGVMRIRRRGSSGGHNGLKSIIEHLGSDAFPRIKIGVGQKPSPDYDLVNWVLGRIPAEDAARHTELYPKIYEASALITEGKIDDAMCRYSR
ncbi:MAG: aminoacyl-tRNA hydrolase [Clostridia bacterium]|nr:aminoacyl-tRNA hydrolase [Clostridia bacterium]